MFNTKRLIIPLILIMLVFAACSSDTSLPTLRPTIDTSSGQPTVDAGSGFDPDLGNDEGAVDPEPTPTREQDANIGSDDGSDARGIGFNAEITGGSIDVVNDGGQYDCTLTGHRIASGVSAAPNITLTIPTEDPIQTHTFLGIDTDGTAGAVVTLASVDDTYTQVSEGTVTVDEVPAEAGEFVSGSFDFTIVDASGDKIGVRGTFAFEASGTTYCTS